MKNACVCVCTYNTVGREDYETAYPLKLLEYLTVGAPTITVETPVTKQIVNDFGTGVLISSASELEMTRSIKSLMTSGYGVSSAPVPAAYKWSIINNRLRSVLSKVICGNLQSRSLDSPVPVEI